MRSWRRTAAHSPVGSAGSVATIFPSWISLGKKRVLRSACHSGRALSVSPRKTFSPL